MCWLWRKFFAFICIFFILLSSISAKKAKKSDSNQASSAADSSQPVKISVPERKNLSYFGEIDSVILSYVENGSPENLRLAISLLKRNKENMTEQEQVLHYIAVSIMQMCWKKQNFTEPTTGQNFKNNYTGSISSSKNGIYDPFVNPTDFLTFALPSLVLAVSETRTDYYEQALQSLKSALILNPSSAFANYLLGILYTRTGYFKEANESFGYAYDLAGSCYETSYAFADSFMAISDPASAFAMSEKLLQSYPQDKNLLKLCAESAFASEDYTTAELYVSRVLQIEPENSYYLLFRARILVKKGEYIRAASLLDAYAKKDSSSRDYLVLRFAVQKNWNKNISAATATIENALVLYPEDSEIILSAASLASETGSKIAGKSGEELADQILANDSGNFEALQIKISSMVAARKWNEAYKASSELIKKENIPRSVLFTHIKICLSDNKKDEAWRYASNLYNENSTDEEVVQSYIDVLVSTKRNAEALHLINQLIPTSAARMKSFLYYERSFLASGENAVLADLRSSLTANPRNKDSLFRLYQIYFEKKEYRKAQYYLKQVVALSPNDESLRVLNQNLENLLKRN
ncbi:MAG: tetratricopeptide repeat protein [Treponema sp.]|nr:tetratricopeptide repeat protein [Treponema sp.]